MIQTTLNSAVEELKTAFLSSQRKCVVLLQGPVGVGKTTFVNEFLKITGFEQGSSPTYSLIQDYRPLQTTSLVDEVLHADLYRINSIEELEGTGFFDHLEMLKNNSSQKIIFFVEWPDKLFQTSELINAKYDLYQIQISLDSAQQLMTETMTESMTENRIFKITKILNQNQSAL